MQKKIQYLCHWCPRGKEKEIGCRKKKNEEIMAENFSNMAKEINVQVQEAQESPNRINSNKIMPRHIRIKLMKNKNKRKGVVPNSY